MKFVESPLTRTRLLKGMNQTEFWGRIGVSQACGSRYEAGRTIPPPVKILLDLAYLESQNKAVDKIKEFRK